MGKRQTRGNRDGPLDVEILRTGVLLSAHQARHLPAGADPLPVGVPSSVGTANAAGAAELFARQDHVHFGCRIKTGNYTGDGGVSNAIAGVGFQPKVVIVTFHATAYQAWAHVYMKSDQMFGDLCQFINVEGGETSQASNKVISLDADGFTVDDNGADESPNKTGIVYDYVALG